MVVRIFKVFVIWKENSGSSEGNKLNRKKYQTIEDSRDGFEPSQ